jgi:hypothetical protein
MNYAHSFWRFAVLALLAILIVASFQLMQPRFLEVGLDPSWAAALTEARRLGLRRFRTEIVFTLEPLAGVYDNAFEDKLGRKRPGL